MSQAWHAAALPLMKKFPPLSELIGDRKAVQPQTNEQMIAAMQTWAAVTKH